MKLAFNELVFEANNTGMLKSLLADVQISGYPLSVDAWKTLEPALYAENSPSMKFRFFVEKLLKRNALLTPSVPVLVEKNIKEVLNYVAKVRLAYRTSPVVYSSVVNLIGGGSSNALLLDEIATKKRFLTHQPNKKVVDMQQLDWLYWLHDSANYSTSITTLSVVYDIVYDDGTSTVLRGKSTVVSNNIAVFCVPTGYWAVAEKEENDKSIVSWGVSLVDNNNITVSEKRQYVLAPMQDLPAKYLMFRNSLNVFDTVRFDGSYAESFESTSQVAVDGQNESFEFDNEGFKTVKINTGRMGRGWVGYLKEVMLSEEVYLKEGDEYVKVVKAAKNVAGIDTGKRDDVAVLEFRIAKTVSYS
jgi:hypothetical protein